MASTIQAPNVLTSALPVLKINIGVYEKWKSREGARSELTKGKYLEIEGDAATHRARRLYQVQRATILTNHGHVALRQKIADLQQNLHVGRKETHVWNWLTHKEAQEGIDLSR